jgi:adenylate cyclase
VFERVWEDLGGQEVEIVRPVADLRMADMQIRYMVALLAPLPKIAKASSTFGYFNANADADGPMRRIRLLHKNRDKLYPALSLASVAKYLDSEIRPMNSDLFPGTRLSGIEVGDELVIPTDDHGRLLVNYYTKPADYFPTYSVADFIDGTLKPEAYEDKIVLFGMTALGLKQDIRVTPFDPTTPGVYVHASAIQNMLDQRFLERFYGFALVEAILYLLLGAILGLALPRLPVWGGLIATAGFGAVLYMVDAFLVFPSGTWIMNVLPTLQVAITYIGTSVYGYLTEGREKRKIRTAFQFYLTKSVVDEMLKDASKLQLGGERRVCTVLFSDIRGFTTISERLSPEELVGLLNSYLTPMTNLVFKYDGTLDKYMGDAIMAIFGAPVPYEDHATRACYSALEMMEELKVLQSGWREQGLPEIDIGIGLNTGPMSVGNMGSEIRFDYTVMGDNVNLGSRLEGINKQYGTNIIVSESTLEVARNDIHVREMDSVRVKGKREPVRIFELLGKGKPSHATAAMIEAFEQGIAFYKRQEWDQAIARFDSVRAELKPNDFASTMYISRCETMRESPPGEGWDGVYTMTTK